MKIEITKQYLKLFLILFTILSTGAQAQKRLSVFFTQEEVDVWKQRAKNGPYKTKGDAGANTPGDWDRIVANANSFVSNPAAERWKGIITNNCVPIEMRDDAELRGKKLRDAGFAYLITENVSYRNAVRTELLGQVVEPYTDFSVKSRWCDGVLRDLPPSWAVSTWLTRLYFAYTCIRPTLSAPEKQKIEKWFSDAAFFFQRNVDFDMNKLYVNRNSNDGKLSGFAEMSNKTLGRTTHYNGYKTSSIGRYYNNRRCTQVIFYSIVGVDLNIPVLKTSGKNFVKEWVMFNIYPDGTSAEFQRWEERLPDKGFNYVSVTASQIVNIADYFARSGDFELYKYTTSKGAFGTQGGNKSIALAIQMTLNYLDGKVKRHGTGSASIASNNSGLIDGIHTVGMNWRTVNDSWFAQANVYYKNDYIKQSYTRKGTGTKPLPTDPASIGMHKPYGGAWDVYPGVLFMFGQMDGKVWPYPGSTYTQPLAINTTSQDVKCAGESDGSASVSATGGTAPYTYKWSTNATANSILGLKAGTYTITVTDKTGDTQTRTVTIAQPTAITINKTVVDETATSKGSITLSVSGGTGNYSYKWSNGATSKDLSGIVAGTYTITVTDQNKCTNTQTITVGKSITNLTITASSQEVKCANGTDGSASVIAVGGVSPYSYKWSNNATTSGISGVKAGTYSVTVTDKGGNKQSKTLTIAQPTAITINKTVVDETATSKGSITLSVSGGTGNYSYKWSNGVTSKDLSALSAGTYTITVTDQNKCTNAQVITVNKDIAILNITTTSQDIKCYDGTEGSASVIAVGGVSPYSYKWSNNATTSGISGVKAGTYSVTVTDKGGNKQSKTLTIAQPTAITINKTVVDETATSKGSITLSVSGGTGNYSYKWSNGVTSKDLSALSAGTYTITVTDQNKCSVGQSIVVEKPTSAQMVVTSLTLINTDTDKAISGFDPLQDGDTLDLSTLPTQHLNLQANVTASEPMLKVMFALNGNKEYRRDNDAPYSLGGDSKGNYLAWKLTPGKYTLTASPFNKAHVKGTPLTITFYIVEKVIAPLALKVNATDVHCVNGTDGSASVSASGGVSPYSYKWSNNATTSGISGVKAGTYSVTVTDKGGNKQVKTLTIAQPTAITINKTVVDETATSKGSITLSVSGGTGNYSYKWSNGATSKDLSGIVAGTYTITVTDQNKCTNTQTITVSKPSVTLNIVATVLDAKCFGTNDGSITISVTGGTKPYSYKWSNNATTSGISGVKAGTYSVTVTDKGGNKQVKTLTIAQPTAITINKTVVDETATSKGSITLSVSGGTGNYSYKWSNGVTSKDLSALSAGTYTITVTDQNKCSVGQSIVVEKPTSAQMVVTSLTLINTDTDKAIAGFDPLQDGDTLDLSTLPTQHLNLQANVTASEPMLKVMFALNGNKEYRRDNDAPYSLGGDSKGNYLAWKLTPGKYTLTASPFNKAHVKGTPLTITFYIVEKVIAPLALKVNATDVHCVNGTDGSASVSASGGVSPYSYKWSNNATTSGISGVKAGTYSVTVTDKGGNKQVKTLTIAQPTAITINKTVVDETATSKGSITLSVSGGTGNYSYKWSNGVTSKDLSALSAGTYTITVTDQNSCSIQEAVEVKNDTTTQIDAIQPILECIIDNLDGTYTATFGYINTGAEEIRVDEGDANFFSPSPLEGNVPAIFLPGRQNNAFRVKFSNISAIVWTIQGKNGVKMTATASSSSTRCTNDFPGEVLKPKTLFSPNEDGIDDLWIIDNIEKHTDYEVLIFNRNGRKVFQAMPYTNNWDGRYQGNPLMAEAYYYLIRSKSEGNIKIGTITLIR